MCMLLCSIRLYGIVPYYYTVDLEIEKGKGKVYHNFFSYWSRDDNIDFEEEKNCSCFFIYLQNLCGQELILNYLQGEAIQFTNLSSHLLSCLSENDRKIYSN